MAAKTPDSRNVLTAGQPCRFYCLRMFKHIPCLAGRYNAPVAHKEQVVAELVCLIAVMSDQDRYPLIIPQHLCHLQAQPLLQVIIHGGKGLVQQKDPGAVSHYAGQRDTLLLAAGQFPRTALLQPLNLKRPHHLPGAGLFLLFRPGHTCHNVLLDSHCRKQGIILKKVSHPALLRPEIHLFFRIEQHFFSDADHPAVRFFDAGYTAECHALSAAGSPQDPDPRSLSLVIDPEMKSIQPFFKIQFKQHKSTFWSKKIQMALLKRFGMGFSQVTVTPSKGSELIIQTGWTQILASTSVLPTS